MNAAEKHASSLLAELKEASAPIDVMTAAEHLGLVVSQEHFDGNVSGMLFRGEDRNVIGVNSSEVHYRQRFTIAHEIGHFLLHPGKQMILDQVVRVNYRDDVSSRATHSEEIQANQFAAALLMPRPLVQASFEKLRRKGLKEAQIISKLANEFDVSPEAMTYRLYNLALLMPM